MLVDAILLLVLIPFTGVTCSLLATFVLSPLFNKTVSQAIEVETKRKVAKLCVELGKKTDRPDAKAMANYLADKIVQKEL